VFGPFLVPSLGKFMYYVSFIYDFSRNIWIYFLQNKYEVFVKFQELKDLMKNKKKVLRIYNSGDFYGNEFEELCKKCGIERETTTPYKRQ
jgi:hypothetical protein